ncbi:MAG TPA: uracil-DNA glycosylase [Bauldia sp.]|nr:uracil-DNA glycosylase [Bauldia sp.]
MPADFISVSDPADLLAWYAEVGVDVALEEEPVDRFATPRPTQAAPPPPAPLAFDRNAPLPSPRTLIAPATQTAAPPDETERAARAAAQAANSLDELRTALEKFEGCGLRKTATQLVFADGTAGSRVMLVGEAPGRDEDIQGLPFVGRSGQLLDRMLAAIGLDRSSVYIANVVPWRPPGNRTPTPQETAACRPFTLRQIELANPDFLICLGAPSAAELMGNTVGILKFRGRWQEFDTGTRKIRAMATLHPAYLLRQPLQKRLAWRDFLMLRQALNSGADAGKTAG